MKIALTWLALMLACGFLYAQQISNVRVEQDPVLRYYKVTFDLSGKTDELYTIKTVPYKAGIELDNPLYLTGQGITSSCAAGKGLQLFWEPVLEGQEPEGWQFKLSAITFPKNMVFVEGGSFQMGSNDGDSDEKPAHQVRVSSFWIGKYEVTQKEWKEVMGSNPSYWKDDKLPVEQISWYDAVDYCNKRSLKEGLRPCYSGSGNSITCDWNANGYRLPTEAEWEYAALGGVKRKGYKYSGSSIISSVAWYDGNSGNKTHEVGTKAANELGIYDMSGNVWEWCWNWYDSAYYTLSPDLDPRGAGLGSYRSLRGGSWYFKDSYCRISNRNGSDPDFRSFNHGFRVVRAVFY
ncbi:MAG: formylglycine-generating enzyme family protein [Candidatus Cloacimonetes bacterium]|jgi:formylglycine-generating enzyme required for sulfatase activity|nr:formylglycine-generating enzyme family protein [Candidatus Cloacimonadota bacterium]